MLKPETAKVLARTRQWTSYHHARLTIGCLHFRCKLSRVPNRGCIELIAAGHRDTTNKKQHIATKKKNAQTTLALADVSACNILVSLMLLTIGRILSAPSVPTPFLRS